MSVTWPKHFDGKRFFNPGAPPAPGLLDVIRWKATSRPEASPEWLDDVQPVKPPRRVSGEALRITLVNHATLLIQHRDLNMVTDPIWSERASPVPWAGPKRKRAPGVRLQDLPPLDAVLLSHNHYDHLDMPTLRRLKAGVFVVPARLGQTLASQKIGPVRELDWGESTTIGSMTIHAVPAVHFSARTLFDRYETLWCGYVLQSSVGNIYFAADTAFGPHVQANAATSGRL